MQQGQHQLADAVLWVGLALQQLGADRLCCVDVPDAQGVCHLLHLGPLELCQGFTLAQQLDQAG